MSDGSESDEDYVASSEGEESEGSVHDGEGEEAEEDKEETKEETGTDDLWADFLESTTPSGSTSEAPSKPSSTSAPESSTTAPTPQESQEPTPKATDSIPSWMDDVPELPAAQPSVPPVEKESQPKPVKPPPLKGGLQSALGLIDEKRKKSVLVKSQEDWDEFKKSKGLEEELSTYNKGKDGFLVKQDFLTDSDHRQFQIERDARAKRRKLK